VQLDGTVPIGCIANPALRELMAHLELAREHVNDRVDAIVVGDVF
jgi:hypothetical protein